jgi:hypothetical protein
LESFVIDFVHESQLTRHPDQSAICSGCYETISRIDYLHYETDCSLTELEKKMRNWEELPKENHQEIDSDVQVEVIEESLPAGKDIPFICKLCERPFASKMKMNSHIEEHYNKKDSFKCALCPHVYFDRAQLRAHICDDRGKQERDKSNYMSCPDCHRRFSNKNAFSRHVDRHSVPHKMFKCRFCSYVYFQPNALRDHELETHSVELKTQNQDPESDMVKNDISSQYDHNSNRAEDRSTEFAECNLWNSAWADVQPLDQDDDVASSDELFKFDENPGKCI